MPRARGSRPRALSPPARVSSWDVDGSGLQKIEDASLAAQLRAKVNAFNLQSAKVVGVAVLLFVVLPELF